VSGSVQPARAGSLGGADPVGSVEVGKHQDVKQLGASRRREGLEASPEGLLHLVEGHRRISHLTTAPTASATPITIALATSTKRTLRQFGSIGGGRGVTGSSNQSKGHISRE
jgi:hypothetical protein